MLANGTKTPSESSTRRVERALGVRARDAWAPIARTPWGAELQSSWGKRVLVWYGYLLATALGVGVVNAGVDAALRVPRWSAPRPLVPADGQTVAQVVPAVVVAIFVFAVGTQFVVAQVVPPARGTRAVEFLRGRHLEWTLSPALALTPLSACALILTDRLAWALASSLLLGAVVYLVVSTGCLLNILREATDPTAFRSLIEKRHRDALKGLEKEKEQDRQHATDDLYAVARTLRGWARTSATAGDSRELQVALEGTLQLIVDYQRLPVERRREVPSGYHDNAKNWATSPVQPEVHPRDVPDGQDYWVYWVPPLYREHDAQPTNNEIPSRDRQPFPREDVVIARIWVANEVGRSLVRTVEFATTTKTLLDRDRARLLLTLEKAARRYAEAPRNDPQSPHGGPDPESVGVIVAYLVELGLGARRCDPAEVDWHFEPLARLAVLHRHFQEENLDDKGLLIGTAAAVLKVTEAIAMARVSEHYTHRRGPGWDGTITYENADVKAIVARTVCDLRNISDVGKDFAVHEEGPTVSAKEGRSVSAIDLAGSTVLEPRDRDNIHPTDERLLEVVLEQFRLGTS